MGSNWFVYFKLKFTQVLADTEQRSIQVLNQVLKEHFEELLKEPMRTVLYTFIPILFLIPSLSNLLAQNLINLDDYTTSPNIS